jgi:HSP20 family protein
MVSSIKEQSQKTPEPERVDTGECYVPRIDIVETKDAFIFRADMPGVHKEDVNVQFENGVMNIEAKVRPRGPEVTAYVWREYGIGDFSRSFTLSVPVKAEEIKAMLKQGELTLLVPKADVIRTRQIPVGTE